MTSSTASFGMSLEVLRFGIQRPGKRGYSTYRIPDMVARRVRQRLLNPTVAVQTRR
jgi:hypothetical protein